MIKMERYRETFWVPKSMLSWVNMKQNESYFLHVEAKSLCLNFPFPMKGSCDSDQSLGYKKSDCWIEKLAYFW